MCAGQYAAALRKEIKKEGVGQMGRSRNSGKKSAIPAPVEEDAVFVEKMTFGLKYRNSIVCITCATMAVNNPQPTTFVSTENLFQE